jgi:hypothetical protein
MPHPHHGPDPLRHVPPTHGEHIPHHQMLLYPPSGPPVPLSDETPVAKIAGRYWCKYCYRTHTSWWMMRQNVSAVDDLVIILCGHCEHTTGIAPDGDQTWWDTGAFDDAPQEDLC